MRDDDPQDNPVPNESSGAPDDPERRSALRAMARYSGAVGGATLVVLTAEEAVAKQPCSTHPNPNPNETNCEP